jgi:hypothetical protein
VFAYHPFRHPTAFTVLSPVCSASSPTLASLNLSTVSQAVLLAPPDHRAFPGGKPCSGIHLISQELDRLPTLHIHCCDCRTTAPARISAVASLFFSLHLRRVCASRRLFSRPVSPSAAPAAFTAAALFGSRLRHAAWPARSVLPPATSRLLSLRRRCILSAYPAIVPSLPRSTCPAVCRVQSPTAKPFYSSVRLNHYLFSHFIRSPLLTAQVPRSLRPTADVLREYPATQSSERANTSINSPLPAPSPSHRHS